VSRRIIIIDGYNVILRTPRLAPGKDRTLRESREKLVNLLSWAMGGEQAKFVVVFDGAREAGQGEAGTLVEVVFSRPPHTADDLIREMVGVVALVAKVQRGQTIDEVGTRELMNVFLEREIDVAAGEANERALVNGSNVLPGHAIPQPALDLWTAKMEEVPGVVPDEAVALDGLAVAAGLAVGLDDLNLGLGLIAPNGLLTHPIGKRQPGDARANDQILDRVHCQDAVY
jgi:predicted RNA-binding protein with PIN domain